jgi:hypothetical protein
MTFRYRRMTFRYRRMTFRYRRMTFRFRRCLAALQQAVAAGLRNRHQKCVLRRTLLIKIAHTSHSVCKLVSYPLVTAGPVILFILLFHLKNKSSETAQQQIHPTTTRTSLLVHVSPPLSAAHCRIPETFVSVYK